MEFSFGMHLTPKTQTKMNMKTKIGILATLVFLSLGFAIPETRTITGTVTSAEDGSALPGVNVILKGTKTGVATDAKGKYAIQVPATGGTLVFSFIGLNTQEVKIGTRTVINVRLSVSAAELQEVVVTGYGRTKKDKAAMGAKYEAEFDPMHSLAPQDMYQQPQFNTEEYDAIHENIFQEALRNPLSTFSIDVDAASYGNMRRFINNGQRPPKDAVRVEEMINYFDYDYTQPTGEHPFNIITGVIGVGSGRHSGNGMADLQKLGKNIRQSRTHHWLHVCCGRSG
jgi:Ca-activated chloride channel family protein